MNDAEFLRRVPKVELHCHFVGTVRPQTLIELAAKHRVPLSTTDPERIYAFRDFYQFLEVLDAAAQSLRDGDDFARAVYESLEDGLNLGNLRYREMFFNPTTHAALGVPYAVVLDALIEGIAAARKDFGVDCRLIPAIDRRQSGAQAAALVEEVIANRREEVIGIGIDYAERDGPPGRFVEAYELAGRAGLKRTAHCCEDNQTLAEAPPVNALICLDELHCDRLDHGYNVLASDQVVARCRDQGVYFTVCSHTSNTARIPIRRATIGRMAEAGLRLTLNTDDPAMFGTDVGDGWVAVFDQLNWDRATARELSLAGIEASWLDDTDKRRLRAEFNAELDALRD